MNKIEKLEIYIKDIKNNNILNVTNSWIIFLKKDDILKIFWLNNKQLEIFLFRNKEFKVIKHENKKLVEIKILEYVFKSISRKNKI